MVESTFIYTAQITFIRKSAEAPEPHTEEGKRAEAQALKEMIGADDVVILESKIFIREGNYNAEV